MAAGVLGWFFYFFAEPKIKQKIRPKKPYHTSNKYKI